MEAIPLLIFLVIAFNVFRSFTKSKGGSAATTDIMQRLKEAQAAQDQRAEQEDWQFGQDNNSPWKNSPLKSNVPKIRKARLQKARKDSHKSPVQHGRRGKNMDQNRHRSDDWGEKGDSGILSGKAIVILLVFGFIALYVMSQIPAQ